MYLRLAFPVLLTVAGCATNPAPQQTAASTSEPAVTCHLSYKTGSNLPVKDCTSMTEADRQRVRDELQQQIRPSGTKPPGGGG
jgi:hypothetical protein